MSKLILDSIFYDYSGLKVLRGAYLEVERAKISCLVGRNGSGKSTLFKIAAGQLHTDSGLTEVSGNRFHRLSKKGRFTYIAYLPQKSLLPKSIKVKDLINKGKFYNDEIIERIINKKIKDVSAGERRYVEILFVISLNKDYLLMDEPFTGLSPVLIEKVIEHIRSVKKQGKGILISDHYMRYIVDIGDVYYLLEDGQIKLIKAV